eukprot:TRINITY_DN124_c2_g1_i1.p1 TRINITY_DN124_c2_g1~~TRINITY_DN124_c2_g1_i1.p1  ORF type:complete len:293 (+),score=43.38 TRINITY_DN124_c2_g1_i1:111-989(+)
MASGFNTHGFGQNTNTAGGGDSGGGYTQSPGAGAGAKQPSSLIPLTCHQVLNAEKLSGEVFKSEGRTLNQVSVCGILNGWQSTSNGREVIVSLCDTTSTINVTFFGNDVMEKLQEESNRLNSKRQYVRIHGHIRPWDQKTTVLGFQISFVSGPMHMMHHLLMCVTTFLYKDQGCLEKEVDPNATQQQGAPGSHQQPSTGGGNAHFPIFNHNVSHDVGSAQLNMPGDVYNQPAAKETLILGMIRSQPRIHFTELEARIRSNSSFPMDQLKPTLQGLLNRGAIDQEGDYWTLAR